MIAEEIIAKLVTSVGSIGSGTAGVVDALQTMNQKPDIWDTLKEIFFNINGILDQVGDIIMKVVTFFQGLPK